MADEAVALWISGGNVKIRLTRGSPQQRATVRRKVGDK